MSIGHSRETLVRAVFEGVALNTRWMMRPVTKFLGAPLADLTMIGGGAISNAWCQIFADVLGLPIRQPHDPVKANARGAAFIAGHGLGLKDMREASSLVQIAAIYHPNLANRALYDERFGMFTDLYRRLAPLYRRMNA